MCCFTLVKAHYWSRNGRNNVLIGLPDLAKGRKIENRDKSRNSKYSLFVFVKGRHFTLFFTNLMNSKLFSELVSSDNIVFLCINATQVDEF